MAKAAIKVEGLWKQYSVGAVRERHDTFYDLVSEALRAPARRLRRLAGQTVEAERFWALRDVNFEVAPGEVVGIIGRNGAGKSTLLKILSRITAPTKGRVEVRGRLASLLEVGTGFHPELSGRENIYLNGAILGMPKVEIDRKFDEIVAFAETEQFIDTPVKRYSSGMYVRLAFAVSAHLDVDVLVVDEVLAVGDTIFQERCLRKMEDVSLGGRAVLFVSHNLPAISRLCSRAVLLDSGQVAGDGATELVLNRYSELAQDRSLARGPDATGPLVDKALLSSFSINGSRAAMGHVLNPGNEIEFKAQGRLHVALKRFRLTLCLYKQQHHVLGLHDADQTADMPACDFESTLKIPAYFLSPGEYTVDVNMYSEGTGEWLVAKRVAIFSVATEWAPLYEPTHAMGIVNLHQVGVRTVLAQAIDAETMH